MWPGQCFGRESSDQQLAGTILLPGLLKEAKESILPVSDCEASVPPVLKKMKYSCWQEEKLLVSVHILQCFPGAGIGMRE